MTVYVGPENYAGAVSSWSTALGIEPDAHMPIPDMGLSVGTVGNVAVIAARPDVLEQIERVCAVILVPNLDAANARLIEAGAEILQEPEALPVGRRLFARTPDGLIAEWTEHRPRASEQPATS